eukprot:343901_1
MTFFFHLMLSTLWMLHFDNVVSGISAQLGAQTWSINISNTSTTEFNNIFWRHCIGSGHAALTLRTDWRQQMKSTHNTLQFQSVRFHGILDDDVGAVNKINDYSFVNIDKIYQYLLSINMKPYVEIGFTPYLFSSNNCANNIIGNHYHPCHAIPNNYTIWYDFIQQWTQHLITVFGIDEISTWKFEVYNEPNNIGWSFNQYLKFYNYTATAIKSVNNKIIVGGPSTGAEAWIVQFCNMTKQLDIPVDFISTHAYPNHVTNGIKPNYINSYYDALNKLLQQVKPYKLPIYISEWNSACCANEKATFYNNDNYYAASFLVFMVNHLQSLFVNNSLLKWMSYWAVSDIFEEAGFISNEFCDYYGLTTTRGINKPIFRTFELLQKYASNVDYKYMTVNMDGIIFGNNTIEMFCLKGVNNNHYSVFMSNWNLLNLNITEKMLKVYVNNYIDNEVLSNVLMYRIDNDTTNPLQKWREMGSPQYPSIQQLNELNQSSQLIPFNNLTYTQVNKTTVMFDIKIPIYGVVVLDLSY